MADHPCANGLTPACFKAYPAYARKALAYKLLMMMIPPELSIKLPAKLHELGKGLPPGWPPAVAAPKWLTVMATPPAAVIAGGISAPSFVAPFSAGPVHPPAPSPPLTEYTTDFSVNGCEVLNHVGATWATVRNTTTAATRGLDTGPYVFFTFSSFTWGDYRISRVIFRVPLTALPAGAVMVSGFLKLYVSSGIGKTAGLHRANAALWTDKEDFLAYNAELDSNLITVAGFNAFPLSAGSLAYCKANAGGTVYFMTREYDHDILDFAPADGEDHWSRCANIGNATVVWRPILTLVYKA